MNKEDLFGGGYKVFIKGKQYPENVVFLPDEPHELQVFLDVIAENHEPPINKTDLLAELRLRGIKPVRFQIDCGVQILKILGVINVGDKNFMGYQITPKYVKAKVKNKVVTFD